MKHEFALILCGSIIATFFAILKVRYKTPLLVLIRTKDESD